MSRRRVNPRAAMRGRVRANSCKVDRATLISDEKSVIKPVQDHFRHARCLAVCIPTVIERRSTSYKVATWGIPV